MKKYRFLYSMKTGIILLVIIAVVSVIGTLIPQENPLHWYEHRYSPRMFSVIKTFDLHDMYHSIWFSVLMAALTLNLLLCSVVRLPSIYKRCSQPYSLGKRILITNMGLESIKEGFRKIGFKGTRVDGNLVYSTKGRIGYLGSWLTHVGLMAIVVFYFLGRIYGFNTQISGLPNETIEVTGTDLKVHVEDFLIDFRDDFSINQYYSYIQILDGGKKTAGTVSVNHPLSYKDYNFYQIATGWAVKMSVTNNYEKTTIRPMYQRDLHFLDEENNKIVRVLDIRPDVVNNSPLPENPIIIYQLIYNNKIESMNFVEPNRPIRWRGETIIFGSPERYTVLEVSNDPTVGGVWFGSVLLILGLFTSFYVNPQTVAAKPLHTGEYVIYAFSLKDQDDLISKLEKFITKGENLNDRKSVV